MEAWGFQVLGIVDEELFQTRCEELLAEFHQRMEEAESVEDDEEQLEVMLDVVRAYVVPLYGYLGVRGRWTRLHELLNPILTAQGIEDVVVGSMEILNSHIENGLTAAIIT